MKKGLIALFIATFIFACSNESDEFTSPVQAELKGTWKVIQYRFEGRTTEVDFDGSSYYDFTGIAGNMDLFMVFNDEGDYSSDGYYYLDNQIQTDEGDTFFWVNYHTVNENGNWEITGNVIDVMLENEDRTIGISELTQTNMTLRINTASSEIDDDNMTTTTTNKQETFVLERQ